MALSVPCDPNKRLKTPISKDSMNRIAVYQDRIVQVFGDSEAYVVQTDEATGQIFIKPTPENGLKPLSLTVITENNLTQDLTLEPGEREATTVVLKGPVGTGPGGEDAPLASPRPLKAPSLGGEPRAWSGRGDGSEHRTARLLDGMRALRQGMVPGMAMDPLPTRTKPGYVMTCEGVYALEGMRGVIYRLESTADTPVELQERDFYGPRDVAVSLSARLLRPGECVHLYLIQEA
jgi:hypothetical protein